MDEAREEQLLVEFEPIVDALLAAHDEGNYWQFADLATPELLERVSDAAFRRAYEEIRPGMGTAVSRRFLGFQHRRDEHVGIWVGRFSDTDDDILLRVGFTRRYDAWRVSSIWIE